MNTEDTYNLAGPWQKNGGFSEDQFIGRRFETKAMIDLPCINHVSKLLSTFFKYKNPPDTAAFSLQKTPLGYRVKLDSFTCGESITFNGNAIHCQIFMKVVAKIDHALPVIYETNKMGFIWRKDNTAIVEAFEDTDSMAVTDDDLLTN